MLVGAGNGKTSPVVQTLAETVAGRERFSGSKGDWILRRHALSCLAFIARSFGVSISLPLTILSPNKHGSGLSPLQQTRRTDRTIAQDQKPRDQTHIKTCRFCLACFASKPAVRGGGGRSVGAGNRMRLPPENSCPFEVLKTSIRRESMNCKCGSRHDPKTETDHRSPIGIVRPRRVLLWKRSSRQPHALFRLSRHAGIPNRIAWSVSAMDG